MDFTSLGESLRWPPVLTTLAVLVLTFAVLVARLLWVLQRQLPPGPRGFPIVGSLLSLGKYPHVTLQNLSFKYGPIMMVHLGSVPTLVVSSPDMAKEILKTHDLVMASRPAPMVSQKLFTYDAADLVCCPYGPQWRNLRKICTLKLLTANRIEHFQAVRRKETLAAVHAILEEAKGGNDQNVTQLALGISMNSTTQMMLGRRFYPTGVGASKVDAGTEADDVVTMFEDLTSLLGKFNISDFVSFLKPYDLQGIEKKTRVVQKRIDAYFQGLVDACLGARNDPAVPSEAGTLKGTLLDHLLDISTDSSDEIPANCLSQTRIKALLLDIYAAAGDTPGRSLEWIFAELLRHPKLLERAQEEMAAVVGYERLVDESDIPNLTFLQCLVKESFRLHNTVPLLVPRESTSSCRIAGYHIPAKTRVFVNTWALHTHAEVWERPYEFDPDRFLDSTVDVKGHDYELIPFGSGRRICPGLALGLIMVQYPLAQLLHCFTWELPDGQKPEHVDLTGTGGLTHLKSSPVIAKARPRLPGHVYGNISK